MIRKQVALLCLCSTLTAVPALAQVLRVDTSRTVIRDGAGNIIGTHFSMQMESSNTVESLKEQIRNAKIACFTNNIKLTSAEAEKFWPLYNEYFEKRENLLRERNELLYKLNSDYGIESASEKEIKTMLDQFVKSVEQESAIHAEYYKKFLMILPPKKVARMYQAEEQFKRSLLRDISRRGR